MQNTKILKIYEKKKRNARKRIRENIGELGLSNIFRFNAKSTVHGRKKLISWT